MAKTFLEITDGDGTRRLHLRDGLTSVGGGDAEVTLAGAGSGQLHIWGNPLRVVFEGDGTPPSYAGVSFVKREFAPGENLEWAGVRLAFGRSLDMSDSAREAALEEIEDGDSEVPLSTLAWDRVRAGLYVDLDFADQGVVAHWQSAVVERNFDVDECAADLIATADRPDEAKLTQRCGRLMRDFVMASMLTGTDGAARQARHKRRSGTAMFFVQVVALGVYSLIVLLSMLFIRLGGTSFDAFFDQILGWFGS